MMLYLFQYFSAGSDRELRHKVITLPSEMLDIITILIYCHSVISYHTTINIILPIWLADIIKMFNPHVQGSSICNAWMGMNGFNVAVGGATST